MRAISHKGIAFIFVKTNNNKYYRSKNFMEEKKLYNAVRKIITLADGRQIEIETGKLAKQADGSVVVKMGDTMLLGTVVAAKDAKPDTDFMPLQVEYKEKYASCGRYPGGFMKREGKANDAEVLTARNFFLYFIICNHLRY